jgi:phosphoheptose isomerase
MNTTLDRIKYNFSESIQTTINSADTIADFIADASERVIQCLLDGNKILSCGNGGSALDALHFSSSMLNRFKYERPSLPAIALNADIATLTSIANDSGYEDIFAKQLRSLGQAGDVLLAISTSGDSHNILHAIKAAHDKKITVIALTGGDGGKIPNILGPDDVEVRAPSNEVARIQETHLLIIHCICDIVDHRLFGHGEIVS